MGNTGRGDTGNGRWGVGGGSGAVLGARGLGGGKGGAEKTGLLEGG